MSTIINARSPYYVKIAPSSGNISSAELKLYIYSGTLTTDKPANATYTISKDKIGNNNYVIFEFTELIRDYIITEYGSYSTDGVWVEADVTITKTPSGTETQNYDYLAFDGYGYFEDGVNPRTSTNPAVTKVTGTTTGSGAYKLIDSSAKFTKTVSIGDTINNTTDSTSSVITSIDSDTQINVQADIFNSGESYSVADTNNYTPQLLQSNTIIYFKKGRDIIFPVFAEAEGSASVGDDGESTVYWNITEEFWNLYNSNWGDIDSDISIGDTNISQDKIAYIRIANTNNLSTGDTIVVSTAKTNYVQTKTITLEEVCEPKFEYLEIIFYNKYGALQSLPFNKKSTKGLKINPDSYKRNLMDFADDPTYSKEKHQIRQFHVTGKENIQVNTGFIDESFNEVIKQLMLSEQTWVYDGTNVKPITLNTKSLQYKTSVNDSLIQYSLEFEYSFNKINDVR